MCDEKIQAIQDVIKMTSRLDLECLNSIKILMKKAIDSELFRLKPNVNLQEMDIDEKVILLDSLIENKK